MYDGRRRFARGRGADARDSRRGNLTTNMLSDSGQGVKTGSLSMDSHSW